MRDSQLVTQHQSAFAVCCYVSLLSVSLFVSAFCHVPSSSCRFTIYLLATELSISELCQPPMPLWTWEHPRPPGLPFKVKAFLPTADHPCWWPLPTSGQSSSASGAGLTHAQLLSSAVPLALYSSAKGASTLKTTSAAMTSWLSLDSRCIYTFCLAGTLLTQNLFSLPSFLHSIGDLVLENQKIHIRELKKKKRKKQDFQAGLKAETKHYRAHAVTCNDPALNSAWVLSPELLAARSDCFPNCGQMTMTRVAEDLKQVKKKTLKILAYLVGKQKT